MVSYSSQFLTINYFLLKMDLQCILTCFKSSVIVIFNILHLLAYLVFIYGQKLYEAFFPRKLKSLKGEVILLTGSANGIGKEIAHELANVGATLILWDADEIRNKALATELSEMGTKVYAYTIDLSNRKEIAATAQKVKEDVGDVTILINNAGMGRYSSFLNLPEDLISKTFEVNLFALMYLIRTFVPTMISKGHGHIVSMASLNAFVPNRDQSIYTSTKHGMTGFLDSFREEIYDHPNRPDIKITTIYPIFVKTQLLDGNRVVPRFPSMAPVLTPEYVAKETVKKFRQNYDHVVLPPSAQLLAILYATLPSKFVSKLQEFLMEPNPVGDYPLPVAKLD